MEYFHAINKAGQPVTMDEAHSIAQAQKYCAIVASGGLIYLKVQFWQEINANNPGFDSRHAASLQTAADRTLCPGAQVTTMKSLLLIDKQGRPESATPALRADLVRFILKESGIGAKVWGRSDQQLLADSAKMCGMLGAKPDLAQVRRAAASTAREFSISAQQAVAFVFGAAITTCSDKASSYTPPSS